MQTVGSRVMCQGFPAEVLAENDGDTFMLSFATSTELDGLFHNPNWQSIVERGSIEFDPKEDAESMYQLGLMHAYGDP